MSLPNLTPAASACLSFEEIFPTADYRHRLKLRSGDAKAFFGPWDASGGILSERARWLRSEPERYLPRLPEAEPLVVETAELAREWRNDAAVSSRSTSNEWLNLGLEIEPDLILLDRHQGTFRMVAGSVSFPSSWAPEAKLGRELGEIHEIVPGLNAEIGAAIARFLERLRPGEVWLRANWGLSGSPELNQHPVRTLPSLRPPLDPNRVWVRIEHQALLALPQTGGVLFGIRVEQRSLAWFLGQPVLLRGLILALESMPDPMARYKGIWEARDHLLALISPGPGESQLQKNY